MKQKRASGLFFLPSVSPPPFLSQDESNSL